MIFIYLKAIEINCQLLLAGFHLPRLMLHWFPITAIQLLD